MKLDAKGLPEFLKAPARYRAVLIYGPDEGLVRERRKIVAAKAGAGDYGPTDLAADRVLADPPVLFEALAAMSLLGENPPVVLQGAGNKHAPILKEALSAEGNFLIVTAGELDRTSALRKLFEGEKYLAAMPCYADEGQTIDQVVRGFFGKHGISADGEVISYLRGQFGNDRAVTLSELEKIALYLGEEKRLSAEDAMALTGGNDMVRTDDLCRAVLSGEKRQAAKLLERLLDEGESPVALCRVLSRQIERLTHLKQSLAHGAPMDKALMSLRPPAFFKEKDTLRRQSSRYSLTALEALLAKVTRLERGCKQGGDASLLFRRALLDL